MLQRRQILEVASRIGLVTFSLLMAIAPSAASAQTRSWRHETPATIEAERLSAENVVPADLRVPQLEANSIIAATLCFAVGFVACLLIVHCMLPSLVHAQCVEIVREYLEFTRRESDIRVVVLDRNSHQPLHRPRRAATLAAEAIPESSYESHHHLRVDKPNPSSGYAPVTPTQIRNEDAPGSMLSQIYEQNLHLRDQLRQHSQSVKP
jgi:hypothetical protein